jgi:hypothetical protein
VIIDELVSIAEQSAKTSQSVSDFEDTYSEQGVALCNGHWPGKEVFVHRGIEILAAEVGVKLLHSLVEYSDGTANIESSFDYKGVHFYQLGVRTK